MIFFDFCLQEVIQESDDSSTTSSSDSESVGEGSLCTNFRDFQVKGN